MLLRRDRLGAPVPRPDRRGCFGEASIAEGICVGRRRCCCCSAAARSTAMHRYVLVLFPVLSARWSAPCGRRPALAFAYTFLGVRLRHGVPAPLRPLDPRRIGAAVHVVRDPLRSTDLPRGGVGTIGNFDGVHLGHRQILETVVARAREVGRPSFAITFEPHPMAVLRPDDAPRRIQTLRQKEEAIEALGRRRPARHPVHAGLLADRARGVRADSAARPARGLGALPRRALRVRAGQAGRPRAPDPAWAPNAASRCRPSTRSSSGGEPVSSTRIRRSLERGAVVEANAMLGRAYELDGLVSRGDRLGPPDRRSRRSTSSPRTSCLRPTASTSPRSRSGPSGAGSTSVTNIGRRPTLYEDYTTTIETYVLDFSADVYGERVRLFFLDRLREERKFPSMMDLKAQIQRDIAATREYFERRAGARPSDAGALSLSGSLLTPPAGRRAAPRSSRAPASGRR